MTQSRRSSKVGAPPPSLGSAAGPTSSFFISYAHAEPDEHRLAHFLADELTKAGQEVFIDSTITLGTDWVSEIEFRIRRCDFLIVLLSDASIKSPMVQTEVRLAAQRRQDHGVPRILPIMVRHPAELGYELDSYLGRIEHVHWSSPADNGRLLARIHEASMSVDHAGTSGRRRTYKEIRASLLTPQTYDVPVESAPIGAASIPPSGLVLYAAIATTAIVSLIAAKSLLELHMLRQLEFNINTLFAAGGASRGFAVIIIITTQVVQPLVFGSLVLIGLNRVFVVFMLDPARRSGRPVFENSTLSNPKNKDDLYRSMAYPEPPPLVAAGAGGVAVGGIDHAHQLGNEASERVVNRILIQLLMCRGSVWQLVGAGLTLALYVSVLFADDYLLASACLLTLVVILFGPSYMTLLLLLVDFNARTEPDKREARMSVSRWYLPYRRALHSMNRPYVDPVELLAYRIAAFVFRWRLIRAAWFEIRRDKALQQRVAEIISRSEEQLARLETAATTRRLELIGELRDNVYCLRANPSAYRLTRLALCRRLVRIVPLF